MSATHVTLAEASDHLAEPLEAVQRGDEVVIETGSTTQVKLVAVTPVHPPRAVTG